MNFMLFFDFFYIFLRAEILKQMHGLRVPATAKEKGNPLGAPAIKSRFA
jgi:hypothetical protein